MGTVAAVNRVEVSGTVGGREALRYSPAGIPILSLQLLHDSSQREAGVSRRVEMEIEVLAVGPAAQALDQVAVGQIVKLAGFLSNRSRRSRRIVLHVTEYEFIEKD